jgi:hypothetical protein
MPQRQNDARPTAQDAAITAIPHRQKNACPTAEVAAISAMEAIDALGPEETVFSVDLGEYSPFVGGGFYWSLSTGITRSNAVAGRAYNVESGRNNRREFKTKLLKRLEEMAAGVDD